MDKSEPTTEVAKSDIRYRLRAYVLLGHNPDGPTPIKFHPLICDEAAAALDAKDAEIERIRQLAETRADVNREQAREMDLMRADLVEANAEIVDLRAKLERANCPVHDVQRREPAQPIPGHKSWRRG